MNPVFTMEELKADATGRQVNVGGQVFTVVLRTNLSDQPLGLEGERSLQERLDWNQLLALGALLYGDEAGLNYAVGQSATGERRITVPFKADPFFTWAEDPQTPWRSLPFPPLPDHTSNDQQFRHSGSQMALARAQARTGLSPLFYCDVADLSSGDLIIEFHAEGEEVTPVLGAAHEPAERRVTLTTPRGSALTSYVSRWRWQEGQPVLMDQVRAPGEVREGDRCSVEFRLIYRPPAGSVVALSEWAALHEQDVGNARRYAAAGRLAGAYKSGDVWLLPRSAKVLPVPMGRPVASV